MDKKREKRKKKIVKTGDDKKGKTRNARKDKMKGK